MSKTIRAKFNVKSITHFGNSGGTFVDMSPVLNNSEENKSLWEATPNGTIQLHITNPDVVIELGEYYVDFTKADT